MQHLTDASKSISINGTEGPAVNYAVCCFPIPGDPAHGFFRGIKGCWYTGKLVPLLISNEIMTLQDGPISSGRK